MDNFFSFLIAAGIILLFLLNHLRGLRKRDERARVAAEKGQLRSGGPHAQHPQIDANYCIGCAACTTVCPEGDVLAMLGGKAVIVNAYKCIGHSLCAEACPVGAITMVMADPSVSADIPHLTADHETTIKNLFIVGELGGLALIKNAVNQGRNCIDNIAKRSAALGGSRPSSDIYDVLIVGAGPGGLSASLRAIEKKLNYITLDEGEIGGTVAKYPRQKLVMTSPVEFPMYGKFKKTELSKEELLTFWNQVLQRADFKFRKGEKVETIAKGPDGIFTVRASQNQYRARNVVLALGKSGSPRKLGVKGEELPKVMYRLIEADHYVHKKILVVGGGDSAVEAAMGLASQVGNTVTLSYRQAEFSRIKDRNTQRLAEYTRKGKLKVILNSNPSEFTRDSVLLVVNGATQRIPNDYVWIFAGGEPPTAFLKKIGVGFGLKDLTSEGSSEARAAKRQPEMAGCQKQQKTASASIRDGIRQHLTSLKTINLSAMDMNVTNVSVNGDTAQAFVEYVPKTGAPAGAAMRVSYSLEKRADQWVVVKTNSLGGAIDHPGPGANPHTQPAQGEVHGTLPNFRDLIPPSSSPGPNGGLPPGHPPVPSSDRTKPD